MVNALRKRPISIFGKTAEASNSQIRSMLVTKSIYTVNDVIGYFRSATNSVNATANFSVKKWFLGEEEITFALLG